jgi:tetratricopeptide (TPR) repeat protein
VRRLVCCWLVLLAATARADLPEPAEAAFESYARLGRRLEVLPTAPSWESAPKDPDSAAALYARGLAALAADRNQAARDAFERAAKLEPHRLEARYALGVAWLALGDATRADEEFSAASDEPRAFLGHAVALFRLGRREEAEEQLRTMIGWKGVLADAASTDLALLLRDAGKRPEALHALAAQPATAEGRLLAAQLALEDNPRAAAIAARSALSLRPNFTDALLTLARALEAAGDGPGAESAARRALELSGDALEAHLVLARAYGRRRDSEHQAAELTRIGELGDWLATRDEWAWTLAVASDVGSGVTNMALSGAEESVRNADGQLSR